MKKNLTGYVAGLVLTGAIVSAGPALAQSDYSYDAALSAFNSGEIKHSYINLKHVLNTDPEHLPAKLLMGRILLMDGYVLEATQELEEVLAAGGDASLVMPALSRAYLFAGQYDKLFAALKQYPLNDEAKQSVTLVAGTALIRQNKRQQAQRLYEQALGQFPQSVALLLAQATLSIDLNDTQYAQRLLSQAQALAGDTPSTLLVQGKLADATGHDALAIYQQAYNAAPDNPATMRAYAGSLAEHGDFEDASALVAKIEAQTPGDVQIQLLKARILALTQNQLEADKILRELTERLSLLTDEQLNEQIELSLIAGIVAYLNKNYGMARTELSRYISKRDPSPEQLGMLTDALLKTSAYKDAIKLLEKHESLVVRHMQLAQLTCDLFIASRRAYKCDQLLPALEQNFTGQETLAVLKAKLLVSTGKPKEAWQLLNGPLAGSARADVLQLKIGLHSDTNDFGSALTLAEQLLQQDTSEPDYQALVADLLIRTGQYERAASLVDSLLNNHPDSVAGLVAHARIAYYQNAFETAIESVEAALKLNKKHVAGHILAAQIYMGADQTESAIEHLLTAKTLDKDNQQSRQLLIGIYREQGNLKAALSEVNALLALERLSADYHLQKASLLTALDDQPGAITQLNMVYALWQDDAVKLLSLARFQQQANDMAGALKSYQSAVTLTPDEALPYLELSSFYIARQQLDDAEATIHALQKKTGMTADVAMVRGDLAAARQQPEQAFEYYLQANQQMRTFIAPLLKAFELARTGTRRAELMDYLAQTSQESELIHLNILADLYFIDGQPELASRLYEQLLTAPSLSRRPYVLNNLANIYARQRPQQALTLIDEALAGHPRAAAFLDTKGWILTLQDDTQAGLSLLRQAYTLDASDPAVQYHIAYALAKLTRQPEAKAWLEKHNTLSHPFREQPEAVTWAQQL